MKWQVGLDGDRLALEELRRVFDSDELSVSEEEGQYYLESSRFEGMASAEAVHEEGLKLASLLGGAVALMLRSEPKIRATNTVFTADDGRRHYTLHAETGEYELRAPVLGRPVLDDGVRTAIPWPGEDLPTLLALAELDFQVAEALRYLAHGGWDWINLRRVFEIVEGDVGKVSKVGYATKSEVKRFTHSIAHPETAHMNAAHARTDSDPPRNPMDHRQAKEFVERILKLWVNNKRNQL